MPFKHAAFHCIGWKVQLFLCIVRNVVHDNTKQENEKFLCKTRIKRCSKSRTTFLEIPGYVVSMLFCRDVR